MREQVATSHSSGATVRPRAQQGEARATRAALRMRLLAAALLVGGLHPGIAQATPSDPSLRREDVDGKIVFRAHNPRTYPISLRLELDGLRNLRPSVALPATVTVPAGADRVVVELTRDDPAAAWRYGPYSYRWQAGSHDAQPDPDVTYQLPFAPGHAYRIVQGYDGDYSHRGIQALDFDLPVGGAVHAARAGRVVRVEQDSDTGGPDPTLAPLANRIWILHEDGTIARYVHLEKEGSDVRVGQWVRAGERIGRAGSTGYSDGPHLHFDVFVADEEVQGARTVPTYFETDTSPRALLQGGETPLRPFPPGQSGALPLNALTRIQLTNRRPVGIEDIQEVNHLEAGQPAYVVLRIGARRSYHVELAFHRGSSEQAETVKTFTTGSDASWVAIGLDVAALRLGGQPCRVRVRFDGHLAGEREFNGAE